MFYNMADNRRPLEEGTIVEFPDGNRYIIDKYIGSGGFALTYIAHLEGESKYFALKELFPKNIEGGIVERSKIGKIVIYDPFTQDTIYNSEDVWSGLSEYFVREAKLTEKASAIYRLDGRKDAQNSPDVLHAFGPSRDKIGNIYLIIDTVQGYAFRSLIEDGFVKDESGQVLANGNLLEIIGVLRDTAQLLSRLHGDNKLWHLDISPDNIYVSYSSAGTRLTPHIIDYGSAYDYKDPDEKVSHLFTCNPFSAPEIAALAEFNDQESGYQAGAFSDTYAIVSTLFYALTGTIYSPNMIYSSRWKELLQDEYAIGGDDESGAFVKELIKVLENGLSSDTSRRYATADILYKELSQLHQLYQKSGNLLALLPDDELMSYLILDKHPLYAYQSKSGNLDVLCLGGGVFVMRMILSMLSCGQMLDRHLNIYVVCQESKASFCNKLLSFAPELESYSNLRGDVVKGKKYVSFEFETVQNLTEPEICDKISSKYSFCRYVIISLGSNNKNIDSARLYAKSISRNIQASDGKTIINYYLSEDAADNRRSDVDLTGISAQVELEPFNTSLSSFASALRTLGQRSLRVKYLYDKISNPRRAFAESAPKFLSEPYEQRSSCAAALHLKYKLASVGINPAPSTNHRAIISAYTKKMNGPERDALLELEHRRWMMYMIADGYRFPSMSQIEEYAFRKKGGVFNGSFHDKTGRWHHCLVPCSSDGICLSRSPAKWEQYNSYEEIDAADYDQLDKMSLKVHLLAKKRTEDPAVQKKLADDLQNGIGALIERRAYILRQIAQESKKPDEVQTDAGLSLNTLRQHFQELKNSMSGSTGAFSYAKQLEKLNLLEYEFKRAGVDASEGFNTVREDLEIFREFEAYKDYKAADLTIINHLLWLMYADENMVLIKLTARTMIDNILGPLILEPKILIYFGGKRDNNFSEFLLSHGNRCSIQFEPCPVSGTEAVFRRLELLKNRFPGKCAVDITGADEIYVTAAVRLASADKNVMLLRSNTNGKIENVSGFFKADIYQLNSHIAADEIYHLYGAREISFERGYMRELEQFAETLWNFYLEFRDNWEMVTAFFYNRGTGVPELRFRLQKDIAQTAQWRTYNTVVDTHTWNSLKLGDCFSKMREADLIRELNVTPRGSFNVAVSFQYPGNAPEQKNDFVFKGFNYFFNVKIWYALRPFTCAVQEDSQNIYIAIQSGSYVEIWDQQNVDFSDKRHQDDGIRKRFTYEQVVPALQRLEQLGFICDLSISSPLDQTPISIKYAYRNLAIKDCLMTSGNILELFTWYSAKKTGRFDDCKVNFSFQQGVKNELDLILTMGINVLVVSCKTAKFHKEHLYEIKYLTERFSLNSKAVIVYSSTQAVDENGYLTYDTSAVKERAKAMDVYLIDMNGMNADDLGKALVDIAEGKSTLLN